MPNLPLGLYPKKSLAKYGINVVPFVLVRRFRFGCGELVFVGWMLCLYAASLYFFFYRLFASCESFGINKIRRVKKKM